MTTEELSKRTGWWQFGWCDPAVNDECWFKPDFQWRRSGEAPPPQWNHTGESEHGTAAAMDHGYIGYSGETAGNETMSDIDWCCKWARLKKQSVCNVCGQEGHWASSPECAYGLANRRDQAALERGRRPWAQNASQHGTLSAIYSNMNHGFVEWNDFGQWRANYGPGLPAEDDGIDQDNASLGRTLDEDRWQRVEQPRANYETVSDDDRDQDAHRWHRLHRPRDDTADESQDADRRQWVADDWQVNDRHDENGWLHWTKSSWSQDKLDKASSLTLDNALVVQSGIAQDAATRSVSDVPVAAGTAEVEVFSREIWSKDDHLAQWLAGQWGKRSRDPTGFTRWLHDRPRLSG